MLTLLLLVLFRNFLKDKAARWMTRIKNLKVARAVIFIIVPVLFPLLLTSAVFAQKKDLSYKVIQNNKNIGWIKLQKIDTGSSSHIQLNSEVRKRMLFLISVSEKQEVSFQNGLMMKSSIFRKVNEEVKTNKHTFYSGTFYQVKDQQTSEKIMINRIMYNQLSLYFKEPVNIKHVYSDNYQRLLEIENKGNSSYMIRLPDGNNNYYYYTNGVCSRIRLEHRLFTIEFIKV